MKEQYRNRYGDVFLFTYDEKTNTVLWQVQKGSFDYCRYGWEDGVTAEDNRYNMVDPSGGPYISAGMESKFIIKQLTGQYVDYLSLNTNDKKDIISVNIHLKSLNK